ncbi:MAG: ABC transporter permease [Melioribacteraceae bacterium]|nr:ABC transporter permease [Melioribacteraceae bacterium]
MDIILNIIRKEFQQFKRDPKMFAIVLVAPIIQLIFLGYAANFDVDIVHTTIYDMNKTEESRNFLESFQSSGYFSFDNYVNSYDEIQTDLEDGNTILALIIPADFNIKLNKRQPAKIQAIFDGSDGNTASVAAGYVNSLLVDYAQNVSLDIQQSTGRKLISTNPMEAEVRVWYNPELTTRNFMVPGIVGLLLMMITLILTSLAVVKEKEIGTLEQLIVTPIKSYQLIIGKLVPFAILGFASVIIVLLAMTVIFDIQVRGSYTFLFASSFIYILSTLGLGLFVSTISKTQQQAMMLAIFVVMLPMVYLSGFVFPIENMPKLIQLVTYLIPLKYFMIIIRGIILKGIGFAELWQDGLILLLMGIAILYFSSLRFKKRLE